MTEYYILDGKEPIEMPDAITWAAQFERADGIVEQTILSQGIRVSTVFLGLNHQWGDGPPLLFETMIFGGEHDEDQWRYSTWDEAVAGHTAAVEKATREIHWLRRVVMWLQE